MMHPNEPHLLSQGIHYLLILMIPLIPLGSIVALRLRRSVRRHIEGVAAAESLRDQKAYSLDPGELKN